MYLHEIYKAGHRTARRLSWKNSHLIFLSEKEVEIWSENGPSRYSVEDVDCGEFVPCNQEAFNERQEVARDAL